MPSEDEAHRLAYVATIRSHLIATHRNQIWPPGSIERMTLRQLEGQFWIPTVYNIAPPAVTKETSHAHS